MTDVEREHLGSYEHRSRFVERASGESFMSKLDICDTVSLSFIVLPKPAMINFFNTLLDFQIILRLKKPAEGNI